MYTKAYKSQMKILCGRFYMGIPININTPVEVIEGVRDKQQSPKGEKAFASNPSLSQN